MLASGMQEGETGIITISDVQHNVFEALLYFIYTDELPEHLQDGKMSITMAQHLLMASDRYQLERLRTICEKRLVDTVEIETVSTTLMLADKCNATNLRQVWPSPCRPICCCAMRDILMHVCLVVGHYSCMLWQSWPQLKDDGPEWPSYPTTCVWHACAIRKASRWPCALRHPHGAGVLDVRCKQSLGGDHNTRVPPAHELLPWHGGRDHRSRREAGQPVGSAGQRNHSACGSYGARNAARGPASRG
jgi:hypothetical protein